MSTDDGQFFSNQNGARDEELDTALEVLKRLSQSKAAAGVGISERRYRDIEHGVRPHKSTREAIIRFAETVSTWPTSYLEHTSPNTALPLAEAERDGGGFPYGAVAVVVFFLICIFAPIFAGGNPQTFTPPTLPISPNEE